MSEQPISDEEREELTSYLDGEAEATARDRIEAKLNQDPSLRAEADALKRTWELLDHLPRTEPTQDFTERTLTRLTAVSSMPATIVMPTVWQRMQWSKFAGIGVALVIGWIAAGIVQHRKPRPLRADDPTLVRDLRLIENLSLYAPVESLEYLQGLDQPERFGTESPGP